MENKDRDKIGLRIGIIRDGVQPLYTSQSAERWSRYFIDDPRNYIANLLVEYTDKYIDFICYGDNVAVYVINKSIPGRVADQIYAMLIIPVNIKVDSDALERLINKVKTEYLVSGKNISEIKKDADEVFNIEYEAKEKNEDYCFSSINNDNYAYQYYNDDDYYYQLSNLLEKNLFSVCYNYYKAVFLLNYEDKDSVKVRPELTRLDQKNYIDKFVLIKYPDNCDNLKLSIDGKELKKPGYPTIFDKKIIIDVDCERFLREQITITTGKEENNVHLYNIDDSISNIKFDRCIEINVNNFTVIDSGDGSSIKNFTIDGKTVSCRFKESYLIESGILIQSDKYNDSRMKWNDNWSLYYDKNGNCWKLKDKIHTYLEKNSVEYKYVIDNCQSDIRQIVFTIKSTDVKFGMKSPLKGYKISNRYGDNNFDLEYDSDNNKISFCKMLIIVFLTLIIGGTGGFFIDRISNKDHKEMISQLKKENMDLNTKVISLGNNLTSMMVDIPRWNKTDFESAGYGELYNAMAELEFDDVKKFKEKILPKKGSQWEEILGLCDKYSEKGIEKSNDYKTKDHIDVNKWLAYIRKYDKPSLVNEKKWYRATFAEAGYAELYDALNTFQFKEILECSKDIEPTSATVWNDIINICNEYKDKKIDKPEKYSKDGSITIKNWIKFVNGKLKQSTHKSSDKPHEDSKNEGQKPKPNQGRGL